MDINKFAMEWISSWNSHDLSFILTHYAEDIEITTPMIKSATGGSVDSLKGKDTVREYWQKALDKIPDLYFEFIDVTFGVNSVVLYYKSIMNTRSMEVMFFNDEGKVNIIYAHYTK